MNRDTPTSSSVPFTLDQRRAIFLAVVTAQDAGESVPAARAAVAARFAVQPADVAAIEREGIAAQWPPLEAE